jgi:hypothetical protein
MGAGTEPRACGRDRRSRPVRARDTELDEKAAPDLAVHVLYALGPLPQKVR